MTEPLTLLVDHDEFVIVNKPSGMPMHDTDNGILTHLRRQYDHTVWHLCHRLDTGTSGCLCIAKSPEAAAMIGEQFATRGAQKYYLALTTGKPRKKQGSIVGDMKNRRRGQFMLMKTTQNPAVTQFFSYGIAHGIRAAIVRPYTGKTHQIRVALKSVGSPILGDTRYSGSQADRLYLHAWQLSFTFRKEHISARCLPGAGEVFDLPEVSRWLNDLAAPETLPWPSVKPGLAGTARL